MKSHFREIGLFTAFMLMFMWICTSVGAQVPPTALVVNYDLTHLEKDYLEPGEKGNLIIVIQNTGGFEAREVKASIMDTSNIKGGGSWNLGDIVPGRSVVIKTTINIDENAYIGTHEIPLFLKYTSYWISERGTKESKSVETNWAIPVHVSIKPLFVLENLSVPAISPGDKFKIGLNLRNNKTDAFDVFVKINLYQALSVGAQPGTQPVTHSIPQQSIPQQPVMQQPITQPPVTQPIPQQPITQPKIAIIGSGSQYIGNVNKGKIFNTEFELYISDDAKTGVYTLPVNIEYEDSEHNKHSDSFTIGIYVSGDAKISITDAKTYPEKIYAGDEDVEAKINIQNQGKGQIKNLKLILKPENPFKNAKSYEQIKNIGLLNSGDKYDATFYVDVVKSALPGKYNLTLLAFYSLNNKEINDSIIIPIFIEEKPLFKIFSDVIKTSSGEKRSIKIKVRNDGEKCNSVTLWVIEKSDQPFSFDDKTEYIGDLDRDEEGEGILEFSVKDDAKPKIYIVPVEIRCVKGDTVLVNSDKITIEVIEVSSRKQIHPIVQAGVVVLAIIIAILLMKYKKQRKRV